MKKKIVLASAFVIVLLLALFIQGNWYYWDNIRSYNSDLNAYGKNTMYLKILNKEVDVDLNTLNESDYRPGRILDTSNEITINGTKVILFDFIYLEEYQELYCGLVVKPDKNHKLQENINFYIKNGQNLIERRSLVEEHGYNGVFQKTWFKGVDLANIDENYFVMTVDNVEAEIPLKFN